MSPRPRFDLDPHAAEPPRRPITSTPGGIPRFVFQTFVVSGSSRYLFCQFRCWLSEPLQKLWIEAADDRERSAGLFMIADRCQDGVEAFFDEIGIGPELDLTTAEYGIREESAECLDQYARDESAQLADFTFRLAEPDGLVTWTRAPLGTVHEARWAPLDGDGVIPSAVYVPWQTARTWRRPFPKTNPFR